MSSMLATETKVKRALVKSDAIIVSCPISDNGSFDESVEESSL